jgi:predicted nucleic acid-binding protein
MKIIFDSNVYISSLLYPSKLTDKLNNIVLKNELICPDIIVDEVLNTLLKKIKKFSNGKILQTTLLDDF